MVKNLPASAGDIRHTSSTPGSGRSPGGEHGNPLQYSCLENLMDRGAWWSTVHSVTKSQTQLKLLSTHYMIQQFYSWIFFQRKQKHQFEEIYAPLLKKAMATHSSTLAWRITWMEEPGGLWSMASQSQTWLSDFTFTFHFHALEKEMATHSSILAWRIPGTEEPGGLPSMGSHRVGHDWCDLASSAAACTSMFTGVLFIVRKIWKQHKCPSYMNEDLVYIIMEC